MPEDTYTLTQAAERIGVRSDTLTALLPDVGVDLAGRTPPMLTQAEYDRLAEAWRRIQVLHKEQGME